MYVGCSVLLPLLPHILNLELAQNEGRGRELYSATPLRREGKGYARDLSSGVKSVAPGHMSPRSGWNGVPGFSEKAGFMKQRNCVDTEAVCGDLE